MQQQPGRFPSLVATARPASKVVATNTNKNSGTSGNNSGGGSNNNTAMPDRLFTVHPHLAFSEPLVVLDDDDDDDESNSNSNNNDSSVINPGNSSSSSSGAFDRGYYGYGYNGGVSGVGVGGVGGVGGIRPVHATGNANTHTANIANTTNTATIMTIAAATTTTPQTNMPTNMQTGSERRFKTDGFVHSALTASSSAASSSSSSSSSSLALGKGEILLEDAYTNSAFSSASSESPTTNQQPQEEEPPMEPPPKLEFPEGDMEEDLDELEEEDMASTSYATSASSSDAAEPVKKIDFSSLIDLTEEEEEEQGASAKRIKISSQGSDTASGAPPPWEAVDLTHDMENDEGLYIDDEIDDLDDEDVNLNNFAELETCVVGMDQFPYALPMRQKVALVREPDNAHDKTAVAVKTMSQIPIGFLPHTVTEILSPLLDKKAIRMDCRVIGQRTNSSQMPVLLRIRGPKPSYPEFYNAVNRKLAVVLPGTYEKRQQGVFHRPIGTNEFYSAGPASSSNNSFNSGMAHNNLIAGSQIVDQLPQIFEKLFDMLEAMQKNLPEYPAPEGLQTELLPYQKQGIGWMLKHESPQPPTADNPVLFWEYQPVERNYKHPLVQVEMKQPNLPHGGLLADEMGLGKTIQILSVILEDTNRMRRRPASSEPHRSTLVVCPLSVVGNWVTQIKTHIAPGALTYYVYHGSERSDDPSFLMDHDVIITTYSTLSSDATNALAPLFQIHWRRVVLDEAQSIKTRNTKQHQAAVNLKADTRWCLTGTPLQNQLDDLHSLLVFMRVYPFDDHTKWSSFIAKPLRNNERQGLERLQVIMQYLCLRRTKTMTVNGKPLLSLPSRNVYLHRVKFTEQERNLYRVLEAESRRVFDTYSHDQSSAEYAHVLVILGRMRQVCNHPSLCVTNDASKSSGDNSNKSSAGNSDAEETIGKEQLISILQDNECEMCPICLSPLTFPVITPCAHLFCKACIERLLQVHQICPTCDRPLKPGDLLQDPGLATDDTSFIPPDLSGDRFYSLDSTQSFPPSSKVNALMDYLEATREKDPSIKSVVFSQWTSMLSIVQVFLMKAGIRFVRLDGTMPRKAREEALRLFAEDSEVVVFLVSLMCGGLGLNLTSASQVFLLDPWWNPAAEDQAIDRVHRIGQKRTVNVFRLVIEGTVEEKVVELQKKKRELMYKAFGTEKRTKEQRKDDLKVLLS